MAWGEGHARNISYIPCRDNQTTRVGVGFDAVDDFADLVDVLTIGGGP